MVSFGTVVAVVTAAAFLIVTLGAAAADRQAVVAGATLWGAMLVLVASGWAAWWLARTVARLVRRRT